MGFVACSELELRWRGDLVGFLGCLGDWRRV